VRRLALVAGCVTHTAAYLNATDGPDSDLRRVLAQTEVRLEPRPSPLAWKKLGDELDQDSRRLGEARKTFSKGPPGPDEMRQAAQAVELAVATRPTPWPPATISNVQRELKQAAAALPIERGKSCAGK
jgi:hypothetical protein